MTTEDGSYNRRISDACEQPLFWLHKGTLLKEIFYFPKYLVKVYDGQKIWFNVSEDELARFTKEEPPIR